MGGAVFRFVFLSCIGVKVVHCEFGQISESTLTDLCATIAAKKMIKTTVSSDEEIRGEQQVLD